MAMMLRYSLNHAGAADKIEQAVVATLQQGVRTQDIASSNSAAVSTQQMGDAVVSNLQQLLSA